VETVSYRRKIEGADVAEQKDKKQQEAVDEIKSERADTKALAEADKSTDGKASTGGTRKPVKRRAKKPAIAQDIFPIDHWRKVSDFVLDGATSAAGTQPRDANEKEALATTSRAVVIKHIGATKHAEEIMLLMVVIPIAVSITVECIQNRRAAAKKAEIENPGESGNGSEKPARSDIGEVGVRQDVSAATGSKYR
jgi:hypothetical protein